ncbi:MAG: hypothetical protein A2940_02375 [Candidatus Wildermuthbacteria bacterium RIFCSPLOWO2_01_FULL_48_29]|uniref:Uncharacterized protein n=2 Tax=Candidatus Wildermuthiibacteriota TaxID=1817923 RepID=A0A1G2RMD4_9BACT|nr:MAG: hypothetical protein A2843_00640 [Candidatus Wildermuthbacteria bacterium RIFCSPHIGHO2_01_FULL_48_27b]OHA73529.1 MAG: hypothetical protein A2940_02375 [Candidatus Wildermuthbacteria bacterium RIFCSPLOWO2_01_FULL_48_29]
MKGPYGPIQEGSVPKYSVDPAIEYAGTSSKTSGMRIPPKELAELFQVCLDTVEQLGAAATLIEVILVRFKVNAESGWSQSLTHFSLTAKLTAVLVEPLQGAKFEASVQNRIFPMLPNPNECAIHFGNDRLAADFATAIRNAISKRIAAAEAHIKEMMAKIESKP